MFNKIFRNLFKKDTSPVTVLTVKNHVSITKTRQADIDKLVKKYLVFTKANDSYFVRLVLLHHKIHMHHKTPQSIDDFEFVTSALLEYGSCLHESL